MKLGHKSDANTLKEHGIVVPETSPGYPLKGDIERMARRRYQSPKPFREGNWWWINPWQDVILEGLQPKCFVP